MKSKKSSLRAALFLALIGAAFAFTACWQGTPAGGSDIPGGGGGGSGGGNTASSIEGITWKSEPSAGTITLRLNGGNATVTIKTIVATQSDRGKYKITGDTIIFTGFTKTEIATFFNKKFKYKVEGDTLTLLDGAMNTPVFIFKKA
ncbi:hypothetical protein ACFGOO_02405 [Treponema vincentii]|uniref:hypothetical protein n=1 Tax=Treponema vincentii TaxID=69710 RepID=UPI0035F54BB4